MDPIAQQFIDAMDSAEEALEAAITATRSTRDDTLRAEDLYVSDSVADSIRINAIYATYDAVSNAARVVYDNAREAAWDLLATSSEPQVAFIGRDVRSYFSAVKLVLPLLPASIQELRKLRTEQGWCSDFTDYVKTAIEAGVVVDDRSAAYARLESYLEEEVTDYCQGQILKLVDAVVVEAVGREVTRVLAEQRVPTTA